MSGIDPCRVTVYRDNHGWRPGPKREKINSVFEADLPSSLTADESARKMLDACVDTGKIKESGTYFVIFAYEDLSVGLYKYNVMKHHEQVTSLVVREP